VCQAPQYIAEARAEGFTKVTCVEKAGPHAIAAALAAGEVDVRMYVSAPLIVHIDVYLGFPPDPQELRARKMGHVLLKATFLRGCRPLRRSTASRNRDDQVQPAEDRRAGYRLKKELKG